MPRALDGTVREGHWIDASDRVAATPKVLVGNPATRAALIAE